MELAQSLWKGVEAQPKCWSMQGNAIKWNFPGSVLTRKLCGDMVCPMEGSLEIKKDLLCYPELCSCAPLTQTHFPLEGSMRYPYCLPENQTSALGESPDRVGTLSPRNVRPPVSLLSTPQPRLSCGNKTKIWGKSMNKRKYIYTTIV